jgi:predicted nucleotidyltransferase component of viral defense system
MIGREELLIYARQKNVDPFWIENDYLQHIALACIYSEFSNELVFKGGTALQKAFGLNRLSRDLDFNLTGGNPTAKMEVAVKRISDFYESSLEGPFKTKHGEGFRVIILGPSYASTGVKHPMPITMNEVEKVEIAPQFKTINPGILYRDPDMRTYSMLVMQEEEMLAEKVRAVLTRKAVEPRDLYDIWFMLNNGVRFNNALARKKTEFDHGTFRESAFKRRMKEAGSAWEDDLKPLINPLPGYVDVVSYLSKNLKIGQLKRL